ncbi:MAG TPA: hypothetical protein ENI95_13885, partial [Chloroflexi bacterium]|nr:hypothetical protein [Chloroflexota bacterium]
MPSVPMRKLLRLGLLLCLVAPVLVAQGQSGDPAPPDAQRVELLDRMGGLVTASVSLPDGSLLIAEGSALVRFDPAGEGQIIARQDLGQGVILDLAEAFPFYYALTEKGFLILGAGGESNTPQRLSFTPGGGQAFAVREGLIAIAAREEGLRLLQVESPGNARLLATLALPGEALDVALDADGTRVYVAGGDGGVLAVDIADPAEPHLIGSLPEIATAETVAMAGSLLAVGSRGQVLLIDPSSAAGRVGLYAPLHRGRRLTIRDDYAYIADAAGGLKIIWLAAPDRPVQVYG